MESSSPSTRVPTGGSLIGAMTGEKKILRANASAVGGDREKERERKKDPVVAGVCVFY